MRVLVVEDEPLVRMAAEEDLIELGCAVTAVDNGDAACAMFETGEVFDVLFTDIRMPGNLDGWELAKRARQLLPTVGVIYASGYPGTMVEPLPNSYFLKKPYRLVELKDAVNSCRSCR
ncbi:response regulator [Novosphingobium aquae]|uniref:Response regulator n=1 Tax=Novosphingobium aquae TaxID=3133435 RepID=A0ABU8SBM8_9SPHN